MRLPPYGLQDGREGLRYQTDGRASRGTGGADTCPCQLYVVQFAGGDTVLHMPAYSTGPVPDLPTNHLLLY